MPLIHQTYNACGPASLAQVVQYFGLNLSQQQISRYTRATERSYMTAEAIVTFAPIFGMNARLYRGGSLDAVRVAIRARLPLIALQEVQWQGHTVAHWRVITGYDDARQVIYVMDPLLGAVTVAYPEFSRIWNLHAGQFALVYPPNWEALVLQVMG